MSSALSIDKPFLLFKLPNRINKHTDRILTGRGFTLRESRRRKSAIVPSAVDGQSISLYNINTGRLVTLFLVSPQTRFLAAPVTVSLRRKADRAPISYTYAICRDGPTSSAAKIKCFSFDPSDAKSPAKEIASAPLSSLSLDSATVVSLEPLSPSQGGSSTNQLLVFFDNGNLACVDGETLHELWRCNILTSLPELDRSSSTRLENVSLTSSRNLKNSTWYKRLNQGTSDKHPTQVMGLVTATFSHNLVKRRLHLIRLVEANTDVDLPSSISRCQPMRSYSLSSVSESDSQSHNVDLKSGLVYQTTPTRLTTWELAPFGFRQRAEFTLDSDSASTVLPIAGYYVLVVKDDSLVVYDIRHASLQATTSLAAPATSSSKKRKADDSADVNAKDIVLLDFFKTSGTAIAISDSQLYSIKIQTSTRDSHPAKKLKTGLLSLSLGQGTGLGIDQSLQNNPELRQYRDAITKGDASTLETAFATAIKKAKQKSETLEAIGAYTVYHIVNSPSLDLIMTTLPQDMFEWLLRNDYINETKINECLRRFGSSLTSFTTPKLIDLLIQLDPSLNYLSLFILHSRPLALRSLLKCAVTILGSYFDSTRDPISDATSEMDIEMAEQAAAEEMSLAVSLLGEGSSRSRAKALKLCVNQLAVSYDPSEIRRAMKLEMSNTDLTLLVEALRLEIADAGWASHCLDVYPAQPDAVESQNEALAAICRLLDCALDALGAGGWLGGLQTAQPSLLGGLQDNNDLIASLRLETSTALETVQESTFLHGFLRDFFRFDRTFQQSLSQAGRHARISEMFTANNPALPIGLGTIRQIEATKVGSGGEIKARSKRDVAQKLSRRVGRYTFEQILL